MAKDYTKYNVANVGEKFNKSRLVQAVIKHYIENNVVLWEMLLAAFPLNLQGNKGTVAKKSAVENERNFYMDAPIALKDGTEIVTSRQWGKHNIVDFIERATALGYAITSNEVAEVEAEAESPLDAEQIAKFKEEEAEIKGDYCENQWEANSLYDDLLEAGDIAWADAVLQKIVDAADSYSTLDTVCESLKKRGENERLLAMAKKAEAMAEDVADNINLANIIVSVDKDAAIKLFQKAETLAGYFSDYTSLSEPILPLDKDWAIRLYQKAETLADSSYEYRDLGELILPLDEDWAIKLFGKAEEEAEEFNDFFHLGNFYVKPGSLTDKDKARTLFEKALPLIDNKWQKNNLLGSANRYLGKEDAFTKKMVQLMEDSVPKMKLPKQYFPDYKLEWGKYITFTLDNGPDCRKIDNFCIKLNMETNEVIGYPDRDDALSRWFGSWEVAIYEDFVSRESYDGCLSISGTDSEDEDGWQISCHGCFEEVLEGELPDGVSGKEMYEAIGQEGAVYELYHQVKTFEE